MSGSSTHDCDLCSVWTQIDGLQDRASSLVNERDALRARVAKLEGELRLAKEGWRGWQKKAQEAGERAEVMEFLYGVRPDSRPMDCASEIESGDHTIPTEDEAVPTLSPGYWQVRDPSIVGHRSYFMIVDSGKYGLSVWGLSLYAIDDDDDPTWEYRTYGICLDTFHERYPGATWHADHDRRQEHAERMGTTEDDGETP